MATRGTSIAPRAHNLAPSPGLSASSPPEITSTTVSLAGLSQIITSKEWVLPPRPKPGRKPSVDTPALKRKAQNRAAQRAFRERRATRVQELEEKLLEVEKEKEVKEMGLVNTINKLKVENQFLIRSLDQLRNDVNNLRNGFQIASPVPNMGAGASKNSPNGSTGSPATSTSSYSVQQVLPAPSADSPPNSHIYHNHPHSLGTITPASSNTTPDKPEKAADNFDCGVCLKDECLCETVGLKSAPSLEETIQSFKPMAAVPLKRDALKKRKLVMEIDFTSQFAQKPMPDLKRLKKSVVSETAFDEASPVENCGFCSDDTPCVCREAAKEAARLNESLQNEEEQAIDTLLPPIQLNSNSFRKSSLPVMHPGPSVEIREITNLTPGAVPVVQAASSPGPTEGGCTGNPGACLQCQTDPLSTLFCATVANKVKEEESVEEKSPKKNPNLSRTSSMASLAVAALGAPSPSAAVTTPGGTTHNGMFIPCADAYKTLSRHKKFNSVDFSTLVGKLTTRGMQVEVQSVANVLRELDRRLYN